DKRTQTVDTGQLHEALRNLESLLSFTPAGVEQWPRHWRDLQGAAAILLDVAQTFSDERGESPVSEILAWARALHAGMESHIHDLFLFEPYAVAGKFLALSEIPGHCREQAVALLRERQVPEATDNERLLRLQDCGREAQALLQ